MLNITVFFAIFKIMKIFSEKFLRAMMGMMVSAGTVLVFAACSSVNPAVTSTITSTSPTASVVTAEPSLAQKLLAGPLKNCLQPDPSGSPASAGATVS